MHAVHHGGSFSQGRGHEIHLHLLGPDGPVAEIGGHTIVAIEINAGFGPALF